MYAYTKIKVNMQMNALLSTNGEWKYKMCLQEQPQHPSKSYDEPAVHPH